MKRVISLTLAAGLLVFALPPAPVWSVDLQEPSPSPLLVIPATPYSLDGQLMQQQQPEVKTFMGKISKSGAKLVLEDTAMNGSYQLDDQKKAKEYEGMNVRVTGTLDAQNNIIHVSSIEVAA